MIDVETRVGTVVELHALDPFGTGALVSPAIWWCQPIDDALVLGSRQGSDLVDEAACRTAGLSVVRRRSGGGAVLMRRRAVTWVDIVLPPGFAPDDVRGSMVWIGERWHRALAGLTDLPLTVHRGGMMCSDWSDLVCFAGVGPGEVVTGVDKLVGLSQRRTRHGIRIQSLVYSESVAAEYRTLFRGHVPATDPPGQGWLPGADGATLVAALAAQITAV